MQSTGFGLQATADGGIGGNGGTAGNPHVGPLMPEVAMAGAGGNGGTASVLLSGGTITVNQIPRISANSRESMSMQMAATAVLAGWPSRQLARWPAMAAMAGVAEPPAPPSWAR